MQTQEVLESLLDLCCWRIGLLRLDQPSPGKLYTVIGTVLRVSVMATRRWLESNRSIGYRRTLRLEPRQSP